MSDRQVDELDRNRPRERKADRLPLRGVHRERVEDRACRLVDGVDEERHRRDHLFRAGERDERTRLGRPLDQDAVRWVRFERVEQAPRRTRTVVPNTVESHRLDRGHQSCSLHAR